MKILWETNVFPVYYKNKTIDYNTIEKLNCYQTAMIESKMHDQKTSKLWKGYFKVVFSSILLYGDTTKGMLKGWYYIL